MKAKVKSLSPVRLFATPWTVAHQASPSMGFSRQECWSGLPVPSPGDLPDPGIEPRSPSLQADVLTSEPPGNTQIYLILYYYYTIIVPQSFLNLCDPMRYTVHGILQDRILEWVAVPFSRGLPNPGFEPRSPSLQAYSSLAEPPDKPNLSDSMPPITYLVLYQMLEIEHWRQLPVLKFIIQCPRPISLQVLKIIIITFAAIRTQKRGAWSRIQENK